ncbi:MAG: hypothetical protein COA94_01595 [Rickettsiales bacterium]|nr:MAG: hypothetical protein COA94_01595 [Rickettsiales bacterium]
MIYEIENLQKARGVLSGVDGGVILSNPQGSTRYYGMRVIDHIFQTLKQEFPTKIEGFIVNADDDYSAFTTAHALGYRTICYSKK